MSVRTIVSANIDGVESAYKKGFFQQSWIEQADVVCLQETRSDRTMDIGERLGFHVAASDRETGHHGGVAIFSREPISNVLKGTDGIRSRGQFTSGTINGVRVASVYVTLDYRDEQYSAFQPLFNEMWQAGNAIVCGDFNTFRDQRDSWRFVEAYKRQEPGCDAAAMRWFNDLFSTGWIDAVEVGVSARPVYMAWPQFRGHHDRPQREVGKNGIPWQSNDGSSRVSTRLRQCGA